MLRFLLVCVLMLNSSMASAHLVEIDCSQADSVLDVIDLILNDGENTDIVFTSSGGICRMEMPFIDGAYGNYQLKSIEIHGDVSVQFQSFESFAFGRIIIKDRGQLTFLDGNHVMISTPDLPENSIFSGPIYVNSNFTQIDLYGISLFNPESFINQHNSQGELGITNYGNLIIENPNEMWWPIKNENILNIDLFDEMVMTTLPILENTMDAELNIHNLIDQAQITASLMDQSRFSGLINLDESINLFVNVSIYLDNTTIAGDGILTLADGGNLSISNDISIRNLDVIGMQSIIASAEANQNSLTLHSNFNLNGSLELVRTHLEFGDLSVSDFSNGRISLMDSIILNYSSNFTINQNNFRFNNSKIGNYGILIIDRVNLFEPDYQLGISPPPLYHGWPIENMSTDSQINIKSPSRFVIFDNNNRNTTQNLNGEINSISGNENEKNQILISNARLQGRVNLNPQDQLFLLYDTGGNQNQLFLENLSILNGSVYIDTPYIKNTGESSIDNLVIDNYLGRDYFEWASIVSLGTFTINKNLEINADIKINLNDSIDLNTSAPDPANMIIFNENSVVQINHDIKIRNGIILNKAGSLDVEILNPNSKMVIAENKLIYNENCKTQFDEREYAEQDCSNSGYLINEGAIFATSTDFSAYNFNIWSLFNQGIFNFTSYETNTSNPTSMRMIGPTLNENENGFYLFNNETIEIPFNFEFFNKPFYGTMFLDQNFTIEFDDNQSTHVHVSGFGYIDDKINIASISPGNDEQKTGTIIFNDGFDVFNDYSEINIDIFSETDYDIIYLHGNIDEIINPIEINVTFLDGAEPPAHGSAYMIMNGPLAGIKNEDMYHINCDSDLEARPVIRDNGLRSDLIIRFLDETAPFVTQIKTNNDENSKLKIDDRLLIQIEFSEPIYLTASSGPCELELTSPSSDLIIRYALAPPFEGDSLRFEHPIAEAEAIIAEDLSDLILTTPRCAARDIAGLSLNVLEPPPVLDPVWATLSIDGVRPRLAALRAEADAARISLGDTLRVTLEWSEPVHMPAPITLRFNSGDTVTFPANDVGATARRAQASFSLSAFPEGGQLRLTGVEPPEALPYDAAGNRVADLEATWLGLVVIPPDGEDLLFDDAHPQALTAAAQLNASSALLKIDDRATITLRFDAPIRPEGLSLRLSVGPLIPLEPVDGAPDLLAGAYTVADGDLTEALTITGVEGQARGLNDQLAEGLEGLVGLGWRFEGEPVAVDGQPPSLIGLDVTLIDGDALIPSLDQPTFGLDLRFDEPIFLESGALSVLLNTAPPSALTLEATAETRRPAPGALDPRPDPRALSLIYRPDVPDIETPNVRALSILAEPDAQGLTDAAGNPLTSLDFEGLNAALEARALTIDTRPPRVIDLEPDTTDAWAEGERHLIHVYFSEPVYLEGTLRLTLNNRAALPLASPTLLGAESADFVYLVGPGQGIDDLQVEGLELTGALTDEGRVNLADLRLEALNLPLGISVLGEDDWRNEGVVDQDAGPTVEPDAARTIQDAAADMHPDDPRRQGGGYGADAVAGTYEEDSGGCHLSGGQPLQAPWAWLLALSLLITRRRLRL